MAQPDAPASIQGCALRIARLDAAGATPAGATNMYTTHLFSKLDFNANIDAGQETLIRNACGLLAFSPKDKDQVKRFDLALDLLIPDPEIHELLVGAQLITSGGQSIGYTAPALGVPIADNGVSLEIWSKAIVGNAPAGVRPWFRWAFPRTHWQLTNRTIDANAMTVSFVGFAEENPNWGNGPNNDWPASASPLLRAYGVVRDDALPTVGTGYQATPAQV